VEAGKSRVHGMRNRYAVHSVHYKVSTSGSEYANAQHAKITRSQGRWCVCADDSWEIFTTFQKVLVLPLTATHASFLFVSQRALGRDQRPAAEYPDVGFQYT
jgi:hypothetical protein